MSGVVGSHIMFGEFKSAAAFIIIFWLSLRCVAKIWGLALRLNMTRARPMFFLVFLSGWRRAKCSSVFNLMCEWPMFYVSPFVLGNAQHTLLSSVAVGAADI